MTWLIIAATFVVSCGVGYLITWAEGISARVERLERWTGWDR